MIVNEFENKYNLLKHIGTLKAELELVPDLKYLPLIFGVQFLILGVPTPNFRGTLETKQRSLVKIISRKDREKNFKFMLGTIILNDPALQMG